MNNPQFDFMSSRLPIKGVAAYLIRSAKAVLAKECLTKSVYSTSAGQMLTSLIRTGQTLLPPAEPPARYCWTFECLRVYVAVRKDDTCLALLVENAPEVEFSRIEETLDAFIETETVPA